MSFLKKKILIVAIVTILSVACVLFAGLGVHYHNKSTKNETSKAADLTISNYDQLVAFANSVNSGNSYQYQTVVLSQNIDCIIHDIGAIYTKRNVPCIGSGSWDTYNGGTINAFNGTFDGQGFTIYNFTLTGGARFRTQSIKDQKAYNYYYYYHMGLFVNIGSSATIKNLKVSSYSLGTATHIETPTGGAHSYYHYDRKSALVSNYHSNGKIESCWVNGSDPYQGVATVRDVMLSSSIINSNGGNISSANNTNGLKSVSSAGGTTGTTWYYSSLYNSGWPHLRVFLKDWTKIEVVSSNTAQGSVSSSYIEVPSNANSSTFDDGNNSTNSSISILSQTITATPVTGYKFSNWVYDSLKYTAYFEVLLYNISFIGNDYTTEIGLGTYSVPYNTQVTIVNTPLSKSGTYSICEFIFNSGGIAYTISYTVVDTHYISGNTLSSQTSIRITQNYSNITVNTAQRSYDITIQ